MPPTAGAGHPPGAARGLGASLLPVRRDREASLTIDRNAGPLVRVVMVGTCWWKWRFEDSAARHLESVLRAFVAPHRGGRILVPPPWASITSTGATSGRRRVDDACAALYAASPAPSPRWAEHGEAEHVVARIRSRLDAIGRERVREEIGDDDAIRHLTDTTIRIFADGDTVAAVLGLPAAHRHVTLCLDFAVLRAEIGGDPRFYCVASASFFSDHPYSSWHGPSPGTSISHSTPFDRWVDSVHGTLWSTLRSRVLPDDEWLRVVLPVDRRDYEAPIFWTLVTPEGDAHAEAVAAEASGRLLGRPAAHAADVAASTIGSDLHVRRRMLDVLEHESASAVAAVPVYVLQPRPATDDPGDQERRTARAILALTRLELRLATKLFDADSDLKIRATYAEVYRVVSEHGAVLWDALAKHLPTECQGYSVEKPIQLIHQIVLQGVADLDVLTNGVATIGSDLDLELGSIKGDAARLSTGTGLIAGLTGSGLALEVIESRQEMTAKVNRTRTGVTWLLDAIAADFDERRVRTVDKSSRGSYAIAVAGASLGLGTLTDLLVEYKLHPEAWGGTWATFGAGVVWVGRVATVAAILALVAVIVRQSWKYRRGQALGSRDFRDQFTRVRRFLEQVSTVELGRTIERLHPGEDDPHGDPTTSCAACRLLDARLARELARQWSDAYPPRARAHRPAAGVERTDEELEALGQEVEAWAVQAMLLTERTATLYPYYVPQLAALYMALSASEHSLLREPLFSAPPEAAVADADLWQVLRLAAFTAEEAHEILEWLRRRRAGKTVEEIRIRVMSLELAYGMSPQARADALSIVRLA